MPFVGADPGPGRPAQPSVGALPAHIAQDRRQRLMPQPRGGQPDGQRVVVQMPADPLGRCRLFRGEGHPDRLGAASEQLQRLRPGQWRDRHQPLIDPPDGLSAGGHDAQPRYGVDQLPDERGNPVQHMFAIVQHQHRRQGAADGVRTGERIDQCLPGRPSGEIQLDHRAHDFVLDLERVRALRQPGQPHPVHRKPGHLARAVNRFHREVGFADTARTDQGDEPSRSEDQLSDPFQLRFPADEFTGGRESCHTTRLAHGESLSTVTNPRSSKRGEICRVTGGGVLLTYAPTVEPPRWVFRVSTDAVGGRTFKAGDFYRRGRDQEPPPRWPDDDFGNLRDGCTGESERCRRT
ncbi:hypothetical protein [Nocardia brevicatena]|uniref:hypothetical protein n=1 Tax=Nocardia brevicatena TaxID=37327 RepID=UPI0012F7D3D1|nr:hypothetical protein [Nocardia brevicatena]